MGATLQSKTCFPGSITDLNKSFYNSDWNQYHDGKSQKISCPGNGQPYDYFLMTQAMDGYSGYGKEQIKQTILKHESVFKHQLQELHRLYKRQRDLMISVPTETSNLGHYRSQLPSDISKGTHIFASTVPLVDSSFDNPFSPNGCIKRKSTLNHFGLASSKNVFSERIVIDLELPAEVDGASYRKQKPFNLADLNEPVQKQERGAAFSAIFSNKTGTSYLAEELQRRDSSAKRTLFGVEIGGSNQTPSFVLPRRNNTCVQNPSTFHHNNHWLYSSDLITQNPGFFAGNSRFTASSTKQNSSAGFAFLNGINSKDSLSDSRDDFYAQKKHTFLDMWKNRDTTQQTLPSWLTAKPCLQNEHIKVTENPVHHFNLDSLQNQSQQFFKKTEMTEGKDTHDLKKLKVNNTQIITKILGVPIIDKKVERLSEAKDIKHHIDLNLSLDEEESPPSFPESVVKIATMEIDLDTPAVESDTDSGSMDDTHMDLVKVAANAIVSISISQPPCKPSSDTLMWFAEIIICHNLEKSSEMDYFEYMTLKLEDNKDYDYYKAGIVEEEEPKEDDNGSFSKRSARKRQGRLRKDFQKDILPSIVSLSKREVTEDLQILEQVFSTTGVSWQSSISKRKAPARSGRGKRRQLVVPDTRCNPPPPAAAVAVSVGGEKSIICREMSLEKSLRGWGRRTRRLPRQRCQNGGNHNQHFALKC